MQTILNPQSGRQIKIGSQTHKLLIAKKILSRDTLDTEKISIVENSRQKMPLPIIIFNKNSTQWINAKEIADALNVNIFDMIKFISLEYEEMKISYNKKAFLIIFPSREPFIFQIVKDYIKSISKDVDFNQ